MSARSFDIRAFAILANGALQAQHQCTRKHLQSAAFDMVHIARLPVTFQQLSWASSFLLRRATSLRPGHPASADRKRNRPVCLSVGHGSRAIRSEDGPAGPRLQSNHQELWDGPARPMPRESVETAA